MLPGSLGILGFGRFGEALASLLDRHGQPWRAFDPAAEVPARKRAASPKELAEACPWILLAVPVREMRGLLAELRPELGASHLVMDAGSVKALPCRWMDECLGAGVPHVGTHPLFGPISLARGDRPLRVVVCPGRPDAAERVCAWLASLGLEVLLLEADAHDRVMAATHAIAFFLSKGLLEAGFGEDLPFAPPSFHAIARLLETVRGDAGHLFPVIQNLNPHARAARARLLEALQAIHGELEAAGEEAPASLAIPGLAETRLVIDEVDRERVGLLARRLELARCVADAKARSGAPVRDPAREAALLANRRAWAGEDGGHVEAVFRTILDRSRSLQEGRIGGG